MDLLQKVAYSKGYTPLYMSVEYILLVNGTPQNLY